MPLHLGGGDGGCVSALHRAVRGVASRGKVACEVLRSSLSLPAGGASPRAAAVGEHPAVPSRYQQRARAVFPGGACGLAAQAGYHAAERTRSSIPRLCSAARTGADEVSGAGAAGIICRPGAAASATGFSRAIRPRPPSGSQTGCLFPRSGPRCRKLRRRGRGVGSCRAGCPGWRIPNIRRFSLCRARTRCGDRRAA
jgi:hypothetical protein